MTQEEAERRFYLHIWPHRAMVLRTARFLTRNVAEADDLSQETMVKAFKAMVQFDERSNANGWLSAILRNTWIDRGRAVGRQRMVTDSSLEAAEFEDSRSLEKEVDLADAEAMLEEFSDATIIAAIQELPEEIRWTLLLVDVQQINHAEAAVILDVPLGTVKSRAHRGRSMLRATLLAKAKQPVLENPS